MYLDDLFCLVQKINKRKIQEYSMQLAITENPHLKERKKLWDILRSQENKLENKDDEFDAAGFEILKSRLRKSSRFVVK